VALITGRILRRDRDNAIRILVAIELKYGLKKNHEDYYIREGDVRRIEGHEPRSQTFRTPKKTLKYY